MKFNKENMPKHIAIIMDGNRRWAKAKGKPAAFGHKAGAKTLENIVRYANKIGLKYITVYAVYRGEAAINCKGKMRIVLLPKQLCKMLKRYIKEQDIKQGSVFVSKYGRSLDRSNIWKLMKALCECAGVSKEKVFPHNLRHLFARTYYSMEKDVVRLADILGHSSVNTTRIYTIETSDVHRRQIQKLGLLRC